MKNKGETSRCAAFTLDAYKMHPVPNATEWTTVLKILKQIREALGLKKWVSW